MILVGGFDDSCDRQDPLPRPLGLLLAQPLLYMALGFSWLLTAFGRILSMMSDGANTPFHWASVVVELALAALPLGFAFGFLP